MSRYVKILATIAITDNYAISKCFMNFYDLYCNMIVFLVHSMPVYIYRRSCVLKL